MAGSVTFLDADRLSFTPVSAANPLPVAMDGVSDGAVTSGWTGGALSTDDYGSVLIEVTAISGSVSVFGGITAPNVLAIRSLGDTTGVLLTSITATGLYIVPAAGQVTASISGSATINVKLKR